MRRYWWAFVSNHREVVCHPKMTQEDAASTRERLKHSTLVQTGQATVGVSVRKATRNDILAWASERWPKCKVTLLD